MSAEKQGTARSQSPAPSYAASARTDTALPPNDADGDINYAGAARSIAHRYASRIAENTCSVKLAEAELVLLEAREAAFMQWLLDYKGTADANAANYGNYARVAAVSGSGLAVLRSNDIEAAKLAYAGLLVSRYRTLSHGFDGGESSL